MVLDLPIIEVLCSQVLPIRVVAASTTSGSPRTSKSSTYTRRTKIRGGCMRTKRSRRFGSASSSASFLPGTSSSCARCISQEVTLEERGPGEAAVVSVVDVAKTRSRRAFHSSSQVHPSSSLGEGKSPEKVLSGPPWWKWSENHRLVEKKGHHQGLTCHFHQGGVDPVGDQLIAYRPRLC